LARRVEHFHQPPIRQRRVVDDLSISATKFRQWEVT
jgi:hypothetical protein